MKVATIVVNYNDEDDTENYIKNVSKFSVIDRILVVDNMSTNENAFDRLKKLEDNKVKVIKSDKNGGYNYGNKPIRRSSWKIRTFWLDVVHSTRILEIIFYKILRNGEYSNKEYEQELLEVEAISGSFFIIKSEVLDEIGLFDENIFLFYEEDILAKKLLNRNYKTICLNSEKFIHYESQTIGKTFSYYKKMKQMYKSKIYYHKNYNNINIVQKFIFELLFLIRNIELAIEIPMRKILRK